MSISANVYMALTFLLTALSVGGLLFAAFQPRLASAARTRRRVGMVLGARHSSSAVSGTGEGKRRRRSVEETLREIEEKQKAVARSRSRKSLKSRLGEAGLIWSRKAYWGVCTATACTILLVLWATTGLALSTATILSALAGLLLPDAYLRFRRKRRLAAFAAQFPDAVDVIVRGVKSGMPLADCIRVVAFEGQEPVRSEFATVLDDQSLGLPVQEAIQRMAERVFLPETNFLSIVITIQSRSGGNLTEALGNLSTVLRERKKMTAKIRAMSAEAKASGWIIGALPVIVASLLFVTSPEYISLLFTTMTGNVVLAVSGFWMLTGVLIMHKMIHFDF